MWGRNTCMQHSARSIATKAVVHERQAYFAPGVCADEWKLELIVVGVHGKDLLACGSAKDLDNLDKLIHAALAWEDRLTKHQLRKHTTSRPHVYNTKG